MLPVFFQEYLKWEEVIQRVQRWDCKGRGRSTGPRPQTSLSKHLLGPSYVPDPRMKKARGISILGTWVVGLLTQVGIQEKEKAFFGGNS